MLLHAFLVIDINNIVDINKFETEKENIYNQYRYLNIKNITNA